MALWLSHADWHQQPGTTLYLSNVTYIVHSFVTHLQAGALDLEAGLATRLAAAAAGHGVDDADLPALDEDDVAIYKKRIVDMLQPGENVLQALRRLGMSNFAAAAAAIPVGPLLTIAADEVGRSCVL